MLLPDFSKFRVIDAHVHCGKRLANLNFENIYALLAQAGIDAACMFAPVEEIYDRYDPDFTDTRTWQENRQAANSYVLSLFESGKPVFPYYFVWNDFKVSELDKPYFGIKWHRHPDEPRYNYEDPECERFIRKLTEKHLPVVLEESLENTVRFVKELAPDATVIIPHLGALNGSFEALEREGIWELPNVYADTALAHSSTIACYIKKYPVEKLMFGSDYPFGLPGTEIDKIYNLGLNKEQLELILGKNILNLFRKIEF